MGAERLKRHHIDIICKFSAWFLALALVYVTLCPISQRPHTGYAAGYERFFAFVLMGMLFGFSYFRFFRTILLLVAFAGTLEVAQNLVATRHGAFLDFVTKGLGGAIGACVAAGFIWFVGTAEGPLELPLERDKNSTRGSSG